MINVIEELLTNEEIIERVCWCRKFRIQKEKESGVYRELFLRYKKDPNKWSKKKNIFFIVIAVKKNNLLCVK